MVECSALRIQCRLHQSTHDDEVRLTVYRLDASSLQCCFRKLCRNMCCLRAKGLMPQRLLWFSDTCCLSGGCCKPMMHLRL